MGDNNVVNHNHLCACGNVATRKLRKVLQDYIINKDGSMSIEEVIPFHETSEFLCDKCYLTRVKNN